MANKKNDCRHCNEKTDVSTGIKTPLGFFCGFECATRYGIAKSKAKSERKAAKLARERERRDKEIRRQRKRDLTPYSKLERAAQSSVNRYIRARDHGKPCISCGKPAEIIEKKHGGKVGGAWDAGHYRSRGAAGHLRFFLVNIWRQCKICNAGERINSGKREEVQQKYRENLIEKIGLERVEQLECSDAPKNKPSRETLERIKILFNKRARWYMKRRGIL